MSEGNTKIGKHKASPYDYIPTDKEESLLRVMFDPAHRMATVTAICEYAGITRTAYYNMHRKPEFSALYRALAIDGIKQLSAQLVQIGIREARKGGSAGYQYWRDLMKMAELLPDEKRDTLTASFAAGNMTITFVDPLTAPEDEDDED